MIQLHLPASSVRPKSGHRLIMAVWLVAALWCTAVNAADKIVSIVTEPPGAFVRVDGVNLGTAPVSSRFNFRARPTSAVSASLTGYFDEEVSVSKVTPGVKQGQIRLVLKQDESYKVTTTSEATNNWIRIQIDPSIDVDSLWQRIVDSVTGRYSSIEQMDSVSGYMRSIPTIRRFQGRTSEFRIRTRFVSSISSRVPLVYKIKIEADFSSNLIDWEPYGRVFKEDAALIEELQGRLGLK